MPTSTTNMGLLKPIVGNDTGLWGGQLNGDLDVLDLLAVYPINMRVQFGVLTLTYDLVRPISFEFCTAGSSDLNLTLPDAVSEEGKIFLVIKTDSGIGAVNLNPSGLETINGVNAPYILTNQWQYVGVITDGSNWTIVINN